MARNFSVDLARLIQKAQGKAGVAVRKVMLETFSRVVMKSPVDTGRFRANWEAGIGSYRADVHENRDRSGAVTISKIESAISGVRLDGRPVFLTNSLPYSTRLEYGYSGQAPSGMVRTTLAEISAHYGT